MSGPLSFAAAGVAAASTLRHMIRELHRDGVLSRATATVLDGLYLAHLVEVWRQSRTEQVRLPIPSSLARAVGGVAAALGASVIPAGMLRFPSEAQVNAQGDQELITDGIYRYSRHPQYLGWTLVLTGVAAARRSPRALALAGVYPVAVGIWLPHEEAHLAETFGEAYRNYRRHTPCWLGRPDGRSVG